MADTYRRNEIQQLLDAGPHDEETWFRLKILGKSETKHLNVSPAEVEAIRDLLHGPNVDPLRRLLADWFNAEMFRISERGHSADWPALIDDAKARHETFGLQWDDSFVPDYVREILAMKD
jgi:hypothetical protein